MDFNQLSDFEKALLTQVREQQTAEAAANGTPLPQNNSGVVLNLGGTPVTFNSSDEASAAVNAALSAANKSAVDLQAENTQIKAALAAAAVNRTPETPKPDDFKERLFNLIDNDPKAAMNLWLSESLFEGKVPDALGILRQATLATANNSQVNAVNGFRAAVPEFNPAESERLEQIRTHLNQPITPEGLEASFAYGVRKGYLHPVQQQQNVDYNQPPPGYFPQNSYGGNIPAPPPRFGNQVGVTNEQNFTFADPNLSLQLDNMSSEQLEQLARASGVQFR